MVSNSLPPAVAALVGEANLAADAALVEVLPYMAPAHQPAVLKMLLGRAHGPSLAKVVGRFSDYPGELQHLIVAHAGDLFTGVRRAIVAADFAHRAGAIEVIVRSGCPALIYLLADALRSRCSRTRERAAEGLRRLTERLLAHLEETPPERAGATPEKLAGALAEALQRAVLTWEAHGQPTLLEAALWLSDRTEPAIRRKLEEPRTRIVRPLNDLITGTSDPRLAEFTLRALAIPALRSSAVRAISRATDSPFTRALLAQTWLLGDAEIEHGCRRITTCRWLDDDLGEMRKLDGDWAVRAVRLFSATGGPPERKIELYRRLLGENRDEIRQVVLWRLIHDESEPATELLSTIAARARDGLARIAARELRRRQPQARPPPQVRETPGITPAGWATRQAFDRYWDYFDTLNAGQCRRLGQALQRDPVALRASLRAKLAGATPFDRARALRIVRALGLTEELAEQVFNLAHDPDSMVRSQAVALLAELPGLTTCRVLRSAAEDPDVRVQANAIEALDLLEVEDRARETKPKLDSPDNRVRANAVKSLLRLEVGEAASALLDMLEDPSGAHRLSGLWVVERLRLRSLAPRVAALGDNDPDERVRQRVHRVLRDLHRGSEGRAGSLAAAPPAMVEPAGGHR